MKGVAVSPEEITDQDFLYVNNSPIRTLILKELPGIEVDYVTVRQLAASLQKDPGTVNFHCKGLEGHGLVRTEIVAREKNVKITDKGAMVIDKIEKKQGVRRSDKRRRLIV
jgi:DNA-binding MarR family transcriptional regulator